jgi:hypothetical protein
MLKTNLTLLNNTFGIDYEKASQFHRASERCMSYIRPSLKRIIKEVEKKQKAKLTGFSYIRQHDRASHTTKVADRKNKRKYYIGLMLGRMLYLDEFNPYCYFDNSFYAIDGLGSSVITMPAALLREIFKYIPVSSYDVEDDRCCIEKEVFLAGIREFAEHSADKQNKP